MYTCACCFESGIEMEELGENAGLTLCCSSVAWHTEEESSLILAEMEKYRLFSQKYDKMSEIDRGLYANFQEQIKSHHPNAKKRRKSHLTGKWPGKQGDTYIKKPKRSKKSKKGENKPKIIKMDENEPWTVKIVAPTSKMEFSGQNRRKAMMRARNYIRTTLGSSIRDADSVDHDESSSQTLIVFEAAEGLT